MVTMHDDPTSQVLRGGTIVDGTGAPATRADVLIAGGRVVEVGEGIAPDAATEIDVAGLVVAPGFIDVHTHYDAQVLWDPDLTPSSWHGVTTVVMGNCGFGIAPTRPQHRDLIAETLENVEGMSVDALKAGIRWEFQSFPQYLDVLDATPTRLNVAPMVGHTPVRLYVLGEEASTRAATSDEIGEMRRIVSEAMHAGAIGFASSKSIAHVGARGMPVPSRLASVDEIMQLVTAMRDVQHGITQVTSGADLFLDEFATMARASGHPVSWTALLTGFDGVSQFTGPGAGPEVVERNAALDADVWPQMTCRPLTMQLNLAEPYALAGLPAFAEILTMPRAERGRMYIDDGWRERARPQVDGRYRHRWQKITVQESSRHRDLLGRSISELARERRRDPFDLLLELSLDEGLATRYRIVIGNDDETELAQLLRDPRVLLGLSDAGAHADQLCDACAPTYLLEHWVREAGVLSVEQAVHRITGQPARVFGFVDRGVVRKGAVADLVAFDPETVGPTDVERVRDLPGGAERLIVRSRGIEHVWVNGTAVRAHGQDLPDVRPGVLLRGGRGLGSR